MFYSSNFDIQFICLKINTMKNSYELQMSSAKETMGALEKKLHQVRLHLKNNPDDAMQNKIFREITLAMTITLNEIEDIQSNLDEI